MAGDWIKMRSNLRTHPKVVRIASALKADRLRVIGALHAVWCLFDEHSVDGQLHGYTPGAIDDDLAFPGFADALIGIGWLASDGNDGLSLPDFDAHNSASAKRRAQESDRKKAERAAAKNSPQDVRNLSGNPSASDADKKRTREEKRREEIKNPSGSTRAAEPRGAKRCPADFVVTPEMVAWAQANAPLVDWKRETEAMRDWEFAHARKDWPAVWRTWLRKANDSKAGKGGATGGKHAGFGLKNYREGVTADGHLT